MSSENEKESIVVKPRKKTRAEQFEKMKKFMQEECSSSKEDVNVLWHDLTSELNKIGPPTHSTGEWKRIWTEHKYNHETKRPSQTLKTKSFKELSDELTSPRNITAEQSSIGQNDRDFNEDISKKLDDILKGQKESAERDEKLAEKLDNLIE